jgi:hypothetical protein
MAAIGRSAFIRWPPYAVNRPKAATKMGRIGPGASKTKNDSEIFPGAAKSGHFRPNADKEISEQRRRTGIRVAGKLARRLFRKEKRRASSPATLGEKIEFRIFKSGSIVRAQAFR